METELMQDARSVATKRNHRDVSDVATDAVRREIAEAAANSELLAKMDDHFRQLAAACFDETQGDSQILAISSATRGTGTSAIALGLASAAAKNLGADTLIIETDLKHPQLARDMGVQTAIGLSDYLSRDVDTSTIINPTSSPRVWLLPAGRPVQNPGPLVRSEKFTQLLNNLRQLKSASGAPAFRTIILDTPPLLVSSDSKVIAQQADGIVLVVRAGETHAHDVQGALRVAGTTPVKGIVLNRARTWLPTWLSNLFGLSQFDFE